MTSWHLHYCERKFWKCLFFYLFNFQIAQVISVLLANAYWGFKHNLIQILDWRKYIFCTKIQMLRLWSVTDCALDIHKTPTLNHINGSLAAPGEHVVTSYLYVFCRILHTSLWLSVSGCTFFLKWNCEMSCPSVEKNKHKLIIIIKKTTGNGLLEGAFRKKHSVTKSQIAEPQKHNLAQHLNSTIPNFLQLFPI